MSSTGATGFLRCGLGGLLHWQARDRKLVLRINKLIKDTQRNEVFKLFAQGEHGGALGHGGLGIGLNVVYQMVQRHGGEVSVFSSGIAGQGSEFVVSLPLMAVASDAPAMATTAPTRDA